MFKLNILFVAMFLVAGSGASYAESDQNSQPMVIASVRGHSTTTIGEKIGYNISFDVGIVNLSEKPIDLSKGCFKVVMPDKSENQASMIDEKLSEGLLKAGENRKSFVEFSAGDDSIYKAAAVKYLLTCK